MAVLERSELEASPLADLHAIADQIGLDGFRRLRKAALIDAILDRSGNGDGGGEDAGAASTPADAGEHDADGERASARRGGARTATRSRRGGGRSRRSRDTGEDTEDTAEDEGEPTTAAQAGSGRRAREGARREREPREPRTPREPRESREPRAEREGGEERIAEGVVDLLGNGSAFLRVDPPEPSDEDVYISAAQVRRCELVSGDRVTGPVRTPRRSERYPSLARIDTINGASAESVAEGTRYDDLAVAYPSERFELDPGDPTLKAIEWLTPLGRGSRVVICGAARAGKSETLRRVLAALTGREGVELTLVLAGVRPEEIAEWQEGPVAPAAALSFAASADRQGQAVEQAVETAKRVAARGGDAIVLIDGLDGLHPHTARKVLAAARKLADGGSLTLIATAAKAFGGESTVISLDVALTSTGHLPALDLAHSGTVKPELLVGRDGAEAIAQARAAAMSH